LLAFLFVIFAICVRRKRSRRPPTPPSDDTDPSNSPPHKHSASLSTNSSLQKEPPFASWTYDLVGKMCYCCSNCPIIASVACFTRMRHVVVSVQLKVPFSESLLDGLPPPQNIK